MVIAREWLNNNIPRSLRRGVKNLIIKPTSADRERNEDTTWHFYTNETLTGTLDLTSLNNLEKIEIEHQYFNRIILTNCRKLEHLHINNCLLRNIIFPTRARNLVYVRLTNNNLWTQDLSCFAQFPNLVSLFIGTDNEWKIRNNIFNRWNGSLIHLRSLCLLELDLNASNVSEGLEHLPGTVEYFTFGNKGREGAGVDRLKETITHLVRLGAGQTMEDWAAEEDIIRNRAKTRLISLWRQGQRLQRQLQSRIIQVPIIPLRRG